MAPTPRSVIVRTESTPLAELRPHPDNPNEGDTDEIAASLRTNGFYRPIVARVDGTILAGHHVYAAALEIGMTHLDVTFVDVDDAAALRILVGDNEIADLGPGPNPALFLRVLQKIIDGAEDPAEALAGTGVALDRMAELQAILDDEESAKVGFTDPDDAPELPPPHAVRLKAGDVVLLGRHRLVVGDARDPLLIREALDQHACDLYLTDPPYGVSYESAAGSIQNDDLAMGQLTALLSDVFTAARGEMAPGAPFYIFGPSGPQQWAFRSGLQQAGLDLRQELVWIKDRFVLGRSDYQLQHEAVLAGEHATADAVNAGAEHEPFFYGWNGGARHPWHGGRKQTSVLEYDRPQKSDIHPTMKPVALLERLILNSTRPQDRVLDTFAGSGSTIIACQTTGRTAGVVELDERYADAICRRFQEFTQIRPVLAATGEEIDFTEPAAAS
jgi:DNA modification methylase